MPLLAKRVGKLNEQLVKKIEHGVCKTTQAVKRPKNDSSLGTDPQTCGLASRRIRDLHTWLPRSPEKNLMKVNRQISKKKNLVPENPVGVKGVGHRGEIDDSDVEIVVLRTADHRTDEPHV